MEAYRWDIPPHVADTIRHLPPDLKRSIKAAVRALSRDPSLGEPLVGELEGLWKYRVKRFRIVYAVDWRLRTLKAFGVGHRRGMYEAVAELLRPRP